MNLSNLPSRSAPEFSIFDEFINESGLATKDFSNLMYIETGVTPRDAFLLRSFRAGAMSIFALEPLINFDQESRIATVKLFVVTHFHSLQITKTNAPEYRNCMFCFGRVRAASSSNSFVPTLIIVVYSNAFVAYSLTAKRSRHNCVFLF